MKIDWSNSKTDESELWKNPMIPVEERMLIADGTIAFYKEVIKNLREKLKNSA